MTTKKNNNNLSLADVLWNEIKELPIEMFSLPNQLVQDHVVRKGGTPDSVILSLKSPAVLPSLEATLSAQKQYRTKVSKAMKAEGENVNEAFPKYDVEESESGHVVVKRHVPTLDKPELKEKPEFFISDKSE